MSMWIARIIVGLLLLAAMGCIPKPQVISAGSGTEQRCISPSRIIVQTSFSRIYGDPANPQSSGPMLVVYVQLRDFYDDPMKAPGQFRYELYNHVPGVKNDVRHLRRYEVNGVQQFDLRDAGQNQRYWDKTTFNYRFELELPPGFNYGKAIVVQASFLAEGNRLEDVAVVGR